MLHTNASSLAIYPHSMGILLYYHIAERTCRKNIKAAHLFLAPFSRTPYRIQSVLDKTPNKKKAG